MIYSPEYDNVLETGGGIYRALRMLGDEPFWVINSDVFTDWCIPPQHELGEHTAHLVLVPTPAHKKNGDFDLEQGLLRTGACPRYTFSGIARYSPRFFDGVTAGRFPLAPMLMAAADRGELSGALYEGVWEDVGTPERLARVNRSQARN